MDYIYKIGDKVVNTRSKKEGIVEYKTYTDNGKNNAYIIYIDGKKTKWSEKYIDKINKPYILEDVYEPIGLEVDLTTVVKEDDYIYVFPKDVLIDKLGTVKHGVLNASVEWDDRKEMYKLCGKKHKVLEVKPNKVLVKLDGCKWRLSSDTFTLAKGKRMDDIIVEDTDTWEEIPIEANPVLLENGDLVTLKSKKVFDREYGDKKFSVKISDEIFTDKLLTVDYVGDDYFRVEGSEFYYPYETVLTAKKQGDIEWAIEEYTGDDCTVFKEELKDYDVKEEIKMMFPYPVLLAGPVGSGKTTIFVELAKELGLKYYASTLTDQTSASEFKGYKNVMNGEYVSTEFREAYEHGGLFVIEEINAATSNMPIIFNTLDNGFFTFADKIVYAHEDFRLGATMNDILNPKDFGGRRLLDKSVKDRFHTIHVECDLESRYSKRMLDIKHSVDDHFKAIGSTSEVTPRDMLRCKQLIDKGVDEIVAIKKTMIPDVSDTDLKEIYKKSKEWK